MFRALRERYVQLNHRLASRAVRRRRQLDRRYDASRRKRHAMYRRARKLKALGPLAARRALRKEVARRRRRQQERSAPTTFFCRLSAAMYDERGSASPGFMIFIALLVLLFFTTMMMPILLIMGFTSYFASVVLELPGMQLAMNILAFVACNAITDKLSDLLDEGSWLNPLSWADKITGLGAGVLKNVGGGIGGLLKLGLDGVGSIAGVVPVVGDELEVAADKTGVFIKDTTGNVLASPVTALKAGLDWTQTGVDAITSMRDYFCEFDKLLDQFKDMGLEDPFRSAANCANWPSWMGDIVRNKDGKPMYCLEGEDRNDNPGLVPAWLIPIYQAAAAQYDVPWELLAAINWNDTEYGAKALDDAAAAKKPKVALDLIELINDTKTGDDKPDVNKNVLVIGDSLGAGSAASLKNNLDGWTVTQDNETGRGSKAALSVFGDRFSRRYGTVVFAVGTNDPTSQAEDLRDRIGEVVRAAGDACVITVSIKRPDDSPLGPPGALNEALAAADRTRIVPWATAAAKGLLGSDGIHPTARGYARRGAMIANTVRDCATSRASSGDAKAAVKLDRKQKEALESTIAAWQLPDDKRDGRVGWIPLSQDEWTEHGSDFGGVPALFKGNPYRGDVCPQPIDVKGNISAGLAAAGDADGKIGPYPGKYPDETLAKAKIAKWMGAAAKANGLPPELPVMAAIVESGGLRTDLTPANSDADSGGFFQMRTSIWDQGPYKGYLTDPVKQLKWFIDQAKALKKKQPDRLKSSSDWGLFIADVERPAAQYRGRYQLQLGKARKLLGAASSTVVGSGGRVDYTLLSDGYTDTCDPVDGIFALADFLSDNGASGDTWIEAQPLTEPGDTHVGGPIADRIVKLAAAEYAKDVREVPAGSNESPDIKRYRTATKGAYPNAPWCSYFTSYIARKAGVPVGDQGQGFGWAQDNYHWGRKKHITVKDPAPGDLIVFGGGGHVGIVVRVDGKKLTTIEGNTSQKLSKLTRTHGDPNIMGYVRLAKLEGQDGGKNASVTASDSTGDNDRDARKYSITRSKADVSYAVADRDGRIIESYRADTEVRSASVTKAMVLVALTDKYQTITPDDRRDAAAMIQQSANDAANRLVSRVGRAAIENVARDAKMADYRYVRRESPFVLSFSRITAADQARFFARIDELIAVRHRKWATGLLANLQRGDWGFPQAARGDRVLAKAGWRGYPEGWTVSQAAQVDGRGYAVLTENGPTEQYGIDTVNGVAERLLKLRTQGDDQTTLPDEGDDRMPKQFAERNFPALHAQLKPNDQLDVDLPWVTRQPDGLPAASARIVTFRSNYFGASVVPAEMCNTPQPTRSQKEIFQAAAAAYGLRKELLAGLADFTSGLGCRRADDDPWSPSRREYLTDATGDGKADPANFVDATFSTARTLRALHADEDPERAVRELLGDDVQTLAKAQSALRRQKFSGPTLLSVGESLIGRAVAKRNHQINRVLCEKQKTYTDCIAFLYAEIIKDIRKREKTEGDQAEGEGGDYLTGGCNPAPLPDLNLKPYSSNAMVLNKQRHGLNVTSRETKGRKAAIDATLAVTRQFQSCFEEYKEDWKKIQINDWNSPGHESHKNGGDNDYTIVGVTWSNWRSDYDPKAAEALARMFLRAGAYVIIFNDPQVNKRVMAARAKALTPTIKRKLGKHLGPGMWTDAQAGTADGLHGNHFHVRWYTGPTTSTPDVKVWLADRGADTTDRCDRPSSEPTDPYAEQSGAGNCESTRGRD